jgi:hypothetical protein
MKKIEVFLRHCYYSKLQELPDRTRPKWFNKIKVFENFKKTINPKLVKLLFIYMKIKIKKKNKVNYNYE